MADLLEGGLGQFQFPLEQWFYEMPVCTRIWTTATVAISVLVQCHVITPFQLFYSLRAVFVKNQYWRLVTTFFYFGPLSLDLLLHVFFLQRYSRLLEESSGRSPAHYSWLLVYATIVLLFLSPLFSIPFLGQALSSTLVYIWSRRNPDTRLSFLGLIVFKAPWLPWVLILFSVVMHGQVPKDEICGVVVGHVYYFFSDVFPPMYNGVRPLDPPSWWLRIFDAVTEVDAGETAHEDIQMPHRDLAAAPEVR
ncbi:MAG: hypothetical protein M1828_005187 [Chrysothrix sp. TS-e1954]|nr:MAG: hypothetical protein M1828_005187 [Chrysothrix sp. TS-e1954]